MKKKALNTTRRPTFSLLEIMVVLVIMGILLSFAIPSYQSSIERSKGRSAEFNLITIYNAEKRYRLDNNSTYYFCATNCAAQIKQNLDVDVNDDYFNYIIVTRAGGFTATATRHNEGSCANQQMVVTEAGSTVNKGCAGW